MTPFNITEHTVIDSNNNDETINKIIGILIKVYKPLSIYLFGSYAWGNPGLESDLDIAVIIETSEEKINRRIQKGTLALWEINYPIDLMVYTQDEFLSNLQHPSTLPYQIFKKGIKIYEAA